MGFLDRLLGRDDRAGGYAPSPRGSGSGGERGGRPRTDDERAVERYRYLLRTAPPDQVEQAHAEAFEQLTPEQRRQVLTELSAQVPESERTGRDDPRSLARMATRAELRQPGTLERSFSRGGAGGVGMGGVIAGSLLASVAGAFIGTAIAEELFEDDGGGADQAGGNGDSDADDGGQDLASGEDPTSGFGGDWGGDLGGGGDFSGGDFGGGDF